MGNNVKQIASSDTRALRHTVLWPHLKEPAVCTIDIDEHQETMHFGTFYQDKIVAIGTFYPVASSKISASNPFRLRAMAVDAAYRGQNHGQSLIEYALTILAAKGCDVVWCDARLRAVPFYERMNFQKTDDIYDIPLIGPHQFMWLRI
jgi:GNAT superfamily N-acetyltransferase